MDHSRRDGQRHHERCSMKIENRIIGKGKHAVTLKRDDGGIAWADELTPANAAQRKRFIEGAREKLPSLDPEGLEAWPATTIWD